jgi:N,N-dimethylformamidase beta subunit-like, C-terminal
VRRVLLVMALFAVAPSAHAATLRVSPSDFSPAHARLKISASLSLTRQVGVQIARPDGRRIGWIVAPSRRRFLTFGWNGRIRGKRVKDGDYLVRLVYRSAVLAERPLKVDATAPVLRGLRIGTRSPTFEGDSRLLTTVSPNGDGLRDVARIRFRLNEPAIVTLEVTRTVKVPHTIFSVTKRFEAGPQIMIWKPKPTLNPRTYLLRLSTSDVLGNRTTYGAENAFVGKAPRAPVVRVQGIDAGFTRQSYLPGQIATLRVSTDAPQLTLRMFQSGPERDIVYADNQMAGVEVPGFEPQTIDWTLWRRTTGEVQVTIPAVASGLYYVQLGAPDGRIGYAVFVVRPSPLGATSRVLVVLPTNTWEAYNFQDVDGDGYGDTWYAGAPHQTVDLRRVYIARGAPPRFYRYDLPFLHWFYWGGRKAEFISDSDFQFIKSGDDLARAYDLILFEGHEEYVGAHEYDVVERYRDLGGNLMFLSANNFFWRVTKKGQVLRRAGTWRQHGRPEARLLGIQYRANDDGRKQGLFTVQNSAVVPWLWAGTGLGDGSTFGQAVGGYGIEIDGTSPETPPGTVVVAAIPDLFGPGVGAEMSYYETPAGAKVFAAGTLDFGGSATYGPMNRILDNLWARLSAP